MFNPLIKFHPGLVERFRGIKMRYMVTQQYDRGKDIFIEENKISIVATHYSDKILAVDHLKRINGDEQSNIYDLEDETDKNKFNQLLQPDSNFIVYTILTADKQKVKELIDKKLKDNIRRYIQKNTDWRIGGKETITPDLEISFGKLSVILKYSGKQDRKVGIEEIEKA